MSELRYRTECEVARERLRQAMRAYLRAPSEENIRRVDAARKRWHTAKFVHPAFAERRAAAMPERLPESGHG